jgi:hypothetical protein
MLRWALVAFGFAVPTLAVACGARVEDTVAVTDDHAVVEGAAMQGKRLLQASIDGHPLGGDDRNFAWCFRIDGANAAGRDIDPSHRR